MSFASLSIRPRFLALFESYILKLDATSLRPALKATILSLLPGLEDESSEDFDQILRTLCHLKSKFGSFDDSVSTDDESYFWQCFFLATITSPSRRQGALAFLNRKLPTFSSSMKPKTDKLQGYDKTGSNWEEAARIVKPEPGLLIRSFVSGLADTQVLTQRGFLDLLVSRLPLDSSVLQEHADKEDVEKLISCAVGVVIRRDMSLNRRLWTWFLGPDNTEETQELDGEDVALNDEAGFQGKSSIQQAYFDRYGLKLLKSTLIKMIHSKYLSSSEQARPYRILLSLMDRWEVGASVVPEIFIPALESAYQYNEANFSSAADEVTRSASMFFDGVESDLIWNKLTAYGLSALESKVDDYQSCLQKLKVIRFATSHFNIREEEMVLRYLPIVTLAYFTGISRSIENLPAGQEKLVDEALATAFEICTVLILEVPSRGFVNNRKADASKFKAEDILASWEDLYEERLSIANISEAEIMLNGPGYVFLQKAMVTYRKLLKPGGNALYLEPCGRILHILMRKIAEGTSLSYTDFLKALYQDLLFLKKHHDNIIPFSYLSALNNNLITMVSLRIDKRQLVQPPLLDMMIVLANQAWYYLDPSTPQHHVESFRCLCQIQDLTFSERLVEAVLASQLTSPHYSHALSTMGKSVQSFGRFSVLWNLSQQQESNYAEKLSRSQKDKNEGSEQKKTFHLYPHALTRPLFLILDTLFEEDMKLRNYVQEWISFLPSLDMLLDTILINLVYNLVRLRENLESDVSSNSIAFQNLVHHTCRESIYYLRHLLYVSRQPSQMLWDYLVSESRTRQISAHLVKPDTTIQENLLSICIDLISKPNSPIIDLDELRIHVLEVIELIHSTPYATSLDKFQSQKKLISILTGLVDQISPTVQKSFLDCIRVSLPTLLVESGSNSAREPSRDDGDRSPGNPMSEQSAEDVDRMTLVKALIECVMKGISSTRNTIGLSKWSSFMADCSTLWSQHVFQHLIPLVSIICKRVDIAFKNLQDAFAKGNATTAASEETLTILLNTLELIQNKASQRLLVDEVKRQASKGYEPPQSLIGNVVSNVFSSDNTPAAVTGQNNSLTLILCYQDSLRVCFRLWAWGNYPPLSAKSILPSTQASFHHISLRIRNRARRFLEVMFAQEPMECLENLAYMWARDGPSGDIAKAVLAFLQLLDGSRPKNIMPAIFNALYSRTNPNAIEPGRLSTFTSKITELELAAFLLTFTETLEDDTLDEIWGDCTTFLLHVLANPLPQRQIVPVLLEFTVILAEKLDNTNFGAERKMRKELSVGIMDKIDWMLLTKV